MEEAEKILSECRQLLSDHRQQLERLLEDPRVFQWRKISFEVHGELLHALGVAAEAGKAASRFHNQARSIFEHLDSCRNELANQETDLQFSPAPPEQTLAAAKNLAQECGHLHQLLTNLQNQFTVLCQADQTLRQKLRPENLVNLAEKKSGAKADVFNAGYRIFALVTGTDDSDLNFQERFADATELKSRLQHVDLQDLPCLAAEIVQQQITVAIETVERVKNVLDLAQQSLSYDLDKVRRLEARMSALAKAPLPEIMENLNESITGLSDCLLNFSYKQHLVKRMQAVTALLDNLKLFNRALKSDILLTLKAEIRKAGSPLNPATVAARHAEKYFAGFRGFWRLIKLFLQSTGEGKIMDALSLQLALEKAIGDCTAYKSSQEVDLQSLRAFINSRLEGLRKPFPHDELSRLMKATLDAYAAGLEKFLFRQRIDDELRKEFPNGVAFLDTGSLTFGKLLHVLERQTGNLERGIA